MAAKNKKAKKQSEHAVATIFTMLFSLALVAVIFFGIFVLIYDPLGENNEQNKTDDTTTDVKKDLKTNTDEEKPEEKEETKPTDTETTYGDDKKGYESGNTEKPVERNEQGKKIATISLSVAENNQVMILSGRVTNFKEEGGSCSYFVKGSTGTKQYDASVIPDAKYTVCEAVKLEKNSLGSGQWTVWMEYKSNNAEGKSETQTVNI